MTSKIKSQLLILTFFALAFSGCGGKGHSGSNQNNSIALANAYAANTPFNATFEAKLQGSKIIFTLHLQGQGASSSLTGNNSLSVDLSYVPHACNCGCGKPERLKAMTQAEWNSFKQKVQASGSISGRGTVQKPNVTGVTLTRSGQPSINAATFTIPEPVQSDKALELKIFDGFIVAVLNLP